MKNRVGASAVLLLASCSHSATAPKSAAKEPPISSTPAPARPLAEEPTPGLRLPADVRPTAEALELRIDPKQDRFSGVADIDVQIEAPERVIWLHGEDLHVTAITVTPEGGGPLAAAWKPRKEDGMAAVTLATPVPAGKARIHVAYDAAFSRGPVGLYEVKEADEPYAFTQFEAIGARKAFPCFDEPRFKIPFTVTLVVPAQLQVAANTHETQRVLEGDRARVSFATTPPLPSYLVAFAVGAFDVVKGPDVPPDGVRLVPLPLRGITPKGRGKEIAYALAHTGEILATLERYVGIAYPYDKLDILAVPGKAGAMENPGAVTFDEQLLLMDPEKAPVSQRRGFASVTAHELAHQWTGDLVTMTWWDDTWLNEAFATWLGTKAAEAWDPKLRTSLALLRAEQTAMNEDALASARAIRQPIEATQDITSAFDAITYAKGGSVLAMFERWAGPEAWQKGLNTYLEAHRFGNARADDFLDAENAATGQDVKTAFHTFLDQPGVPLVEVGVDCRTAGKPKVHLTQSRFFPLGSKGDAHEVWQIPLCVRAGRDVACTLLTTPEGDLALPGAKCPAFVMPNADGAGYYRFALAPPELANLRTKGLATLTDREKMAYEGSLRAEYQRGTTPFEDILEAVRPLAADAEPAIAEAPMDYVSFARDWLYGDPARADVETYARGLYAPSEARLGWEAKKGESDETRALRASVLRFLAQTGRDAKVRAKAKRRGLAYLGAATDGASRADAVDADVAGLALAVVGEEADPATWHAMKALYLRTVDETVRGNLLVALSSAKSPDLAAAARELVLEPAVRDDEMMTPLVVQMGQTDTRDAAWAWLRDHYDAIAARLPKLAGVWLLGMGWNFCDEARAAEIGAFFTPKVDAIEGGRQLLASTLEFVRLCAARRRNYLEGARRAFRVQR